MPMTVKEAIEALSKRHPDAEFFLFKECLNIIKEKLKLAEVQLPESFSRYL
jgi:hypothetical protein